MSAGREERLVRILGSRFLVVVALGLLPMSLGGLSGCDSKPADGSLVESQQVDADQIAEIKAQRARQKLERQKNFSKKGKMARGKSTS